MDIVCFQKSRLNLFFHIFLVFLSLCCIPWLKHCLIELTFRRRWPCCTNKWMTRNKHIVVAIRKYFVCKLNNFVRIYGENAIKITRCIISIQFWIHVGTCLQMFCIHCICCQIIFDGYINIYAVPICVFQTYISIWIICEEKTMCFGRANRDSISLIGVRSKKTSVKCDLHL